MYVIGLDIGTTGTKALLIDQAGNICGSGYQGYKLITHGNHVEQNPEDWWKACCTAIRQACAEHPAQQVTALSVSAQGATTVALTDTFQPIGNAITWLDTRAAEEAKSIGEKLGEEYIYQSTGWKLSPSLDAAKILYMKKRAAYQNARWFVSTLEYINQKLTGRLAIDATCAGIRQLYHTENGCWDSKILKAIGCSPEELPEILPAGTFLGNLLPKAASDLGLTTKVKIYNGAHDQHCASLGSGAVHNGDLLLSTGTAWAVMGISQHPIRSKSYISSCPHPISGLFGNMVSLTGAGTAYQWIKDNFFDTLSFTQLDHCCAQRIGKAKDLIFLPWLSGTLYPYFMSDAKGGFLGADLSTTSVDFALSVMESAAFSVKSTIEDFAAHGHPSRRLYVMGGAAKSSVWMDILQNVTKTEIRKLAVTDVCALGAAAIALISEGYFSSFSEAASHMSEQETLISTLEHTHYYQEKYQLYRDITKHMSAFYQNHPL